MAGREVEVRRSRRRRRTVSAYVQDGRVVVLIPDAFSRAQEAEWVEKMLARLERRSGRVRSDDDLVARARALAAAHDLPEPVSVRWVTNQQSRWGSCTPADGSIRLSHRLQPMPSWVVDYVLVHELAHLVEPGHDARFHALVARYPRTERASGYLDGYSAGAQLEMGDDLDPVDGDGPDHDVSPEPAPPARGSTARRSAGRRPATSARRATPR